MNRRPYALHRLPTLVVRRESAGAAPAPAPPAAPTGLSATAGDRQVTLSWDAQAGVDVFTVYLNTVDDLGTALASTSVAGNATSYVHNSSSDDPLLPGYKYYYWLVAVNNTTGDSDPAGSVTARSYVTLGSGNQTTLVVPDGATLQLQDLLFSSSPIPAGLTVSFGGEYYEYISGTLWLDQNSAAPSGTIPISGSFNVDNSLGSSFTFWNTEP